MRWWTKDFPCKEHDVAVDLFNRAEKTAPQQVGWLRAAREALMLPAETVSRKLKISSAGYSKLEQMESEGKITLETLARAAEALDCELIYAIRPKLRQRFSQLIWQKLLPQAEIHSWVQRSSLQTKPAAVAMIASNLFRDPEFRRKQGWKKRRKSPLK